jgi:predicted ATPase with chaperone activity
MDAMDNRYGIALNGSPGPEGGEGAGKSPAEPQSLQDLGLPLLFLGHLTLKHCFYMDFFTLGDLVERLKVSASILSEVLEYLKKSKWVEVRGPDPMHLMVSSLTLANRHSLTEAGRKQASQLLEYDAYAGPAPVMLKDYWRQVTHQTIGKVGVTPDHIQRVLDGLVLSAEVPEQLGVAAVSGKPLFLYGPPGNGKTSVCQCLSRVWEDDILVPYALFVDGQVIQVFDEITHVPSEVAVSEGERVDRRWLRCRRPVVTVGGELTLDMLDLAYKPALKYFEAPLQLKANNGVFVVDDFGRQQISPQELLNRWIIPLETRQDFLRLRTGQKFAVPFDQFIIFATNLEPRSLVDDAFLRRLRSKVKVDYVSRTQFADIFRLFCDRYHLEFDPAAVEYLLGRYYDDGQRPLTACHPRDLLEQILDYCRYYQLAPRLTPENLDRACQSYFVA